jgi:16S rRNA G966 N2-methylase RsmD
MSFNLLSNDSDEDNEKNKYIKKEIENNEYINKENNLDNNTLNDTENVIFNYEYNLDDNKYEKYVEPIILENINMFPFFKKEDIEKSSNNKKLLKITDKGKYSISKPVDADWITNIIVNFSINILKKDPSTQNIIDATAGIGGNVINFSKNFLQVSAIEINSVHYEVLKNNVNALDLKNIKLYNDNFLNFVEIHKNNNSIFFLDPPWGGKSYKNFKYFNLKLGKIMIHDVINILYKKGYKYVFLKAPINLNVSPIIENVIYLNFNIHKNINGNMLLISFY